MDWKDVIIAIEEQDIVMLDKPMGTGRKLNRNERMIKREI